MKASTTACVTATACAGQALRQAGVETLAQALQASRCDTLATFGFYEAALSGSDFVVPQSIELNPPLWELGHIGWFQTHWLGRNPERLRGAAADPAAPRLPAARANADALYDSSQVAQHTRWSLPLPGAQATRADLAAGLAQSLALLAHSPHDDAGLYFHRLCLFHEDMHHEAALQMAQALGISVPDARWQPQALTAPATALALAPCNFRLGQSSGFAFDNELGVHEVKVPASQIDSQVLRWADYLPFIEAGGYEDERWWPGPARAWRQTHGRQAPRYLRRDGDGDGDGDSVSVSNGSSDGSSSSSSSSSSSAWQQQLWGRWQALDPALPACHLSAFEAQAWCAWAGRRLPTEAEWECAALSLGNAFQWGSVWEWTASPFAPYPGFVAHPYRDYSAPWFDGRPVLRGGSFGTQPRMKHVRYRNYFQSGRNDIFAGFRSCAR